MVPIVLNNLAEGWEPHKHMVAIVFKAGESMEVHAAVLS